MGPEPLPEMLPIPIRQKLSPLVAMERDGRCLRRHSNVRVPRTTRLRGSESLYSSPYSAVLGSSVSETETRQVWLTSPVSNLGKVLPPYSMLCCYDAHLCGVWQFPQRLHKYYLYSQGAHEAPVIITSLFKKGKLSPRKAQGHILSDFPAGLESCTVRDSAGLEPSRTQAGPCVWRGRPRGARLASCRGMPREGWGPCGEVIKSRAEPQGAAAGRVFLGPPCPAPVRPWQGVRATAPQA